MNKERSTQVRGFVVEDNIYVLWIDLSNDSTYVVDENDKILLEFNSSCYAFQSNGYQLGKIFGVPENGLTFKFSNVAHGNEITYPPTKAVEAYLDFEVVIAKELITNKVI